ncbi:hypothetical protein PPL_08353 [Heterostelium album PN500]|uniref:Uncharacterized protein n=1 Tax=Heterostelium pallidum (strain ATCC 26659 / Pp 5 / PN500) TaxID=670386 RepID=D3BHY5_HETP5|nr:hypothetical protein PPL_08353 [Heterostelium album PN500]EFA78885.1 hypothetical protein PPL_08353 [Heterostelium album PN500]|eukprot:XP_020431009.1 hypothetical protein PPL_08353 [Heterostelium album PN500]
MSGFPLYGYYANCTANYGLFGAVCNVDGNKTNPSLRYNGEQTGFPAVSYQELNGVAFANVFPHQHVPAINHNYKTDNYIQNRINYIWTSIKRLSNQYRSLGDKVTEISNHFEKLHQFLIVEEHRLKKPLTIDQDTVKEDLDKQLNELKSIINIINFNNKEVENVDDDDQIKSIIEDTTDLYSISTINS